MHIDRLCCNTFCFFADLDPYPIQRALGYVLVHSQIDIFGSNHWRSHDVIELHNKLKDKMQLISADLCRATEWKENKLPNITQFKLPF
jgi:hypothetical protein